MKKIFKIMICFGVAFFILESLAFAYEKAYIRVAVLNDVDRMTISMIGRYKIVDGKRNEVIDHGRTLKKKIITVKDGLIKIGLKETRAEHLIFVPNKEVRINFNDRELRYRGKINLFLNKKGKLLAVNEVELEKYVQGVLYHEVSDRWPIEAMKAQAVAVRTYALYRKKINKDRLYDVTNDIYSQMYGGKSAEKYRTNIAAKRTKGKILIYEDEILPAYFHANCGGHTEDVTQLWEHDLTPLKGVECPYCRNMPSYAWKKNFRSSSVQETLNKNGFDLGLIKSIEILKKNASGRIIKLAVHTRDGKTKEISGKKFRSIIGPNTIKSNKYDIAMQGYFFDVIGKGWGHGVGMCQWGANVMSQKRKKYDEILRFYYPDAEIVDYRKPEHHQFVEMPAAAL